MGPPGRTDQRVAGRADRPVNDRAMDRPTLSITLCGACSAAGRRVTAAAAAAFAVAGAVAAAGRVARRAAGAIVAAFGGASVAAAAPGRSGICLARKGRDGHGEQGEDDQT